MTVYFLLKAAHVLGACVLIGTGTGIAFFMLIADRSRDPRVIAHVAGTVVIADALFTATAVVLQPATGLLLANWTGLSLSTPWLVASVALYLFIGALWLPVVWMQARMRRLAAAAAASGEALPAAYHRLMRAWVLCGIPAFVAVLAILWLMVAKPYRLW